LSHSLLFGNEKLATIRNAFYGSAVRSWELGFEEQVPSITDFKIFGARIIHIQQSVEEWRPRNFWELFAAEYKGKLELYATVFTFFFGIISIFILIVGCYQAYLGYRQFQVALQALPAPQ
jgi:hypothetical protein